MINHIFIDKDFGNGFKTNESAILNTTPYIPEVLILGTFNPNTGNNTAHFFYGRKNNYFWYAIRNIFNSENLPSRGKEKTDFDVIKKMCVKLKLTFADLILSVNWDLKGNGDKELKYCMGKELATFNTDNIISFLSKNESVKIIYFTRTPKEHWEIQWEKIQDNFKGRIFKSVYSPSGYAPCPKGKKKLDYVIECWKTDMIDLIKKFK